MIIIDDNTKKILAEKQKYYNVILGNRWMKIKIEALKIVSSNWKENTINIVILKTDKDLKDLSQLEYCNLDKNFALVLLTGKRDEPLSGNYEMSSLWNQIKELWKFKDCKVNTLNDIFRQIENIIK